MDVPVPKTDQNVFWDKNCLCCRHRIFVLQTRRCLLGRDNICLVENILILQDYNLELEDIIHDLCGLVGGAMDLTTPRCQVQFPLPLFTPSQWRRFGIPSGGFFPTKIRLLSYLHGILLSHNPNWARRDGERSIWAISLTNTPRKK